MRGGLKSGGLSSCLSPSRFVKPAARYAAKSSESSMSAGAPLSSGLSSRKLRSCSGWPTETKSGPATPAAARRAVVLGSRQESA